MTKYLAFLICILLISPFYSLGQKRDSIYLYNGQILIGEVQSATLGVITIDDIDLKIQHIKFYKIKRMSIVQRFKLITIGKKLYYGSLKPCEQNGWVKIMTGGVALDSIPLTDISVLLSLDKDFLKRLEGSVSAGFSYSKSSSIGQINLNAEINYTTKNFEYELTAVELASIDSSKFSRDNENVQFYAIYDMNTSWFVAGSIQYQRNLELSISRRYLQMFGGGNKIFTKKTWQLLAITGISVNQEKSTSDQIASSTQWEVPAIIRFNYFKFSHPDIQITSTQSMYFSLTEKGRFRMDGSTSFSWQIIRYFYLTLSPYTNYDSKPPAVNGNTFDYGIVLSISYKF